MNAKKCKKARQLARLVSKGQPSYKLLGRKHSKSTQAILSPGCTRAVYQGFKKLIRRGICLIELEKNIKTALATQP